MGVDLNKIKKEAKKIANKATKKIRNKYESLTKGLSKTPVSNIPKSLNSVIGKIGGSFKPVSKIKGHAKTAIEIFVAGLNFMIEGFPYYVKTGFRGAATGVKYSGALMVENFDTVAISLWQATLLFLAVGIVFAAGIYSMLV